MPGTDEFLVFSWNIEKKSLSTFDRHQDTESLIAGGISDHLVSSGGEERPFVGFLMEVKGTPYSVGKMCERLEQEFHKQRGSEARFEPRFVGGSGNMREWMILVSHGLDVKVSDLDVRAEIQTAVDADIESAKAKSADHEKIVEEKFLRPRADSLEKQQARYRENLRGAHDFRNGVVAEFEHGGRPYRIGSIHAPGPGIMEGFSQMLPAIQRSAANAKLDLITADLNKHGDFDERDYRDLSREGEGTTVSSMDPTKLTKSRRDRVLVKKDAGVDATMLPPIVIQREGAQGKSLLSKRKRKSSGFTQRKKAMPTGAMISPLTDHAMIVTVMAPGVVPGVPATATGAPDPFAPPALEGVGGFPSSVPPEPPPLASTPPSALAGGALTLEPPPTMGEVLLTTPNEPVVSPLAPSSTASEGSSETLLV